MESKAISFLEDLEKQEESLSEKEKITTEEYKRLNELILPNIVQNARCFIQSKDLRALDVYRQHLKFIYYLPLSVKKKIIVMTQV